MSKKRLYNRLDAFFSDLDQTVQQQSHLDGEPDAHESQAGKSTEKPAGNNGNNGKAVSAEQSLDRSLITFSVESPSVPGSSDSSLQRRSTQPAASQITGIHGVKSKDGRISPATGPLTGAGVKSLDSRQLTTEPAENGRPAAMAVPFQVGDEGRGLLEVVSNERRDWNEDERLLIKEVADQLALAIENARLYTLAQQELAERTRVQQEVLRRNEELAALNQIGQELSRLASQSEVLKIITNTINRLVGECSLMIAVYRADQKCLSFPVCQVDGRTESMPDVPFGNGIVEYVLKTGKALNLSRSVQEEFQSRQLEALSRWPVSLLTIPMGTFERPFGAILIQDFEREGAFSSTQADLLSTVAAQATTALQNASLFAEIRSALAAIENRERYESSVARAVASLTEFGTRSLHDVLGIIGGAVGANRVYFCEVRDDISGMYWQLVSEWVDETSIGAFDRSKLQHIPTHRYSHWVAGLQSKGWVNDPVDQLPAHERDFLQNQGIHSNLILAVHGKHTTPGFIAFDVVEKDRIWLQEEIGVLRVATDALSNTIIREDLLGQLQVSLDETESLYNSSHRLALANDLNEMVAVIAGSAQPSDVNRAVLLLFEGETSGRIPGMKIEAAWYSGRGTPPPQIGAAIEPGAYERLFITQTPIFYDDLRESTIAIPTRGNFLSDRVRSLAILPLWASKRQLGVLLLMAEDRHHFTGREIRTYPPLIDQMATSIENLRLFTQTQEALAETELLFKISNGIAQAKDARDLISLVAAHILPENADRAGLIQVTQTSNGEPVELEVIGQCDQTGDYHFMGLRLPASMLPMLKEFGSQAVIIKDLDTETRFDPVSRNTLAQFGIASGCLIPLRSAGRLAGLITISSRRKSAVSLEEANVLQVAGNGIAVALERQRLLEEARRRAVELEAAAEIARDTTSTLSLDTLLERIVELVVERFRFDYASIFLLDDARMYAVVQEATGEPGQMLKERGYKIQVGSKSIVGMVCVKSETITANDVASSPIYSPTPLLPDTRSEMAIPLHLGDRLIGVLDIQSSQVNAFTQDDTAVLEILADQIAVAIDNARSYALAQKAIEEMREVDRLKSQFLANMSHELRTPLNSIIGFSRVILKGIDGPINDIQQQDLTAIYNSGQHLLSLINNILDLSKIEAGKMDLSMGELDLAEIVKSVMSTAVGLVKDKQIELKQVIPPELPPVRGDTTRIRQVLLNLISNAAKFTEEGQITVEVSVTENPAGKKEMMLAVTDSGPGIAKEDEVKLFQPFSQVDDSPTRKTGGTGLGLSICRSLIELHGGRIGLLWSEVGKGSTFFFTLPLADEPQPELLIPAGPNSSSTIILAIDDDPQIIRLYERYLKPHGYSIVAVNNPKQAVDQARAVKPFAITLDIMMPDRDGWLVLQDLKNDPHTRDIPVIICSIIEEEQKGISLGASDYLVKPFLREDLINAIKRINPNNSVDKILVIDDDPDDLRLVQKMLEDLGHYQVVTAQGGANGWEVIKSDPPDLVVLDLFMPDMDGFSLLQQIRSSSRFTQLPVIILTGADLTADQHQQLADFGQQWLSKGYLKEEELLITLEQALNKLRKDS